MKKALVLVTLFATLSAYAQVPTATHNYEFANGNWFDGQKFVQRTFYSVAGVLSSKRPAHVDRVFDLNGKYVVPPALTRSIICRVSGPSGTTLPTT